MTFPGLIPDFCFFPRLSPPPKCLESELTAEERKCSVTVHPSNGNSPDKLRHPRSDAYLAEQVLQPPRPAGCILGAGVAGVVFLYIQTSSTE